MSADVWGGQFEAWEVRRAARAASGLEVSILEGVYLTADEAKAYVAQLCEAFGEPPSAFRVVRVTREVQP